MGTRRRLYFNPRSPCGERPAQAVRGSVWTAISIHAPRVGSDTRSWSRPSSSPYFNPRSPCGERPENAVNDGANKKFQSTLPVWGATPRPPHLRQSVQISIHAPRVGSDGDFCSCGWVRDKFQSTLPVWGATVQKKPRVLYFVISIHAPRVGSDPRTG